MLSKVADLLQVAKYGVRREVAHRHVVDHPLAQGGNLAGGQDGVVNRCRVAHDEQQYRTSRRLTYSYWIWLKKKVVATEILRSGLVQCCTTACFLNAAPTSGWPTIRSESLALRFR